jgi:hypothetical protein
MARVKTDFLYAAAQSRVQTRLKVKPIDSSAWLRLNIIFIRFGPQRCVPRALRAQLGWGRKLAQHQDSTGEVSKRDILNSSDWLIVEFSVASSGYHAIGTRNDVGRDQQCPSQEKAIRMGGILGAQL